MPVVSDYTNKKPQDFRLEAFDFFVAGAGLEPTSLRQLPDGYESDELPTNRKQKTSRLST